MSDEREPLRDTGRHPKIVDEPAHMSNARIFDTFFPSIIALVKASRLMILVMVIFMLLSTATSISGVFILYQGQLETRALMLTIGKKTACESQQKD